jgi:hypothetical protein
MIKESASRAPRLSYVNFEIWRLYAKKISKIEMTARRILEVTARLHQRTATPWRVGTKEYREGAHSLSEKLVY